MKRFLFAVFAIGTCVPALADYTTYSGGDIVADAFACTTNTRVLFGGSGRTWTLSQDASIHSGGFAETGSAGTPKTVKFDFTEGNHTLTLRSANFLVYNHDVSVDFLGGTWDFNAHPFAAYNSSGGANNRVTLDACSFVNTSQFNGLNNTNSWWQLKNGSSFACNDLFTVFASGSDSTGSLIELSGGSKMTTGNFYMRPLARTGEPTAYQGATFRVTGAGSSFSHGSTSFMMGHGYNGEIFEVASNATAAIGYPRFGYSAATRNTGLYVHDGAVLTSVNSMTFGNAGESTYHADRGGMFVRAERGATVKSGVDGAAEFCFGSADNELFVSNATFACGAFLIGRIDGATGNVVRILGPSTSFRSNNWTPLFGNGGQNLVEVGDFANVTNGSISFDASSNDVPTHHSPSNILRITNGATLTVSGNFSVGSTKTDRAVDNRVEIKEGGTLTIGGSVTIEGTNNCLVVDNGTFEATLNTVDSQGRDTAAVNIGREYNGRKSNGCTLVVRGDCPKVKIPKTSLRFDFGSKLRFELPPNGYAYATADEAPMELLQIMNYTMDYEITGLDELQKNLQKSCDIPLIRMSYRMWDGTSAFAALNRINEKLAETNPGCRLWKQDNRQTTGGEIIYLHVKAHPGLMLIVR